MGGWGREVELHLFLQFFVFSNALDYLINIVSWWFVVCYLGNFFDLWHHKARIIWIRVFCLEAVYHWGKSFLALWIDNLTFDVVQFIKYVRQAYEMSVSKKRLHTNEQCFILLLETNNASLWCYKRTTLSFGVTNEQRFPLVLPTNNAFRTVTQTYFSSDHTIDFCVVKVFMVLLETTIKFIKLTKGPWVRNDYIPNERRFIFLLETNNVSLCCKEWTTLLESSWCCRKQRAL